MIIILIVIPIIILILTISRSNPTHTTEAHGLLGLDEQVELREALRETYLNKPVYIYIYIYTHTYIYIYIYTIMLLISEKKHLSRDAFGPRKNTYIIQRHSIEQTR